jgi:phosphoribosylanthranilate isomerase
MAIKNGAWAIGQVFAESKRRISVEQAEKINRQLGREIIKIGVFVNEEFEALQDIIKACSLDMVQLHGEEAPEYAGELNLPVIKSFTVTGPVQRSFIDQWPVWACLFDTYSPAVRGGSGKIFNWSWLEELKGESRIILAGGLNPANVGSAIDAVHPLAVDVSSGVEFPGGGKSEEKIEQFMAAVRQADKNISISGPGRPGSDSGLGPIGEGGAYSGLQTGSKG